MKRTHVNRLTVSRLTKIGGQRVVRNCGVVVACSNSRVEVSSRRSGKTEMRVHDESRLIGLSRGKGAKWRWLRLKISGSTSGYFFVQARDVKALPAVQRLS